MIQELERRLKKLMEAPPTEALFQDCKSYHLVRDDTNRTMPFLTLEPSASMLGTNRATLPPHHRGAPEFAEHFETADGSSSDTSLSSLKRIGTARRFHRQCRGYGQWHSVTTRSCGTSGQIGLSQFFAAHPSASPPTKGWSAHRWPSSFRKRCDSPSHLHEQHRHSMLCQCGGSLPLLADTSLQRNLSHPAGDMGMRCYAQFLVPITHPVDLTKMHPFRWLLLGTWTVESFRSQQDASEFAIYLLHVMQPQFLHCGWVTRPALLAPGR